MPNGKLPTFSPEIDELIRGLDRAAATGREYTPWDDPKRRQIEQVVDGVVSAIGHEELQGLSETVGWIIGT